MTASIDVGQTLQININGQNSSYGNRASRTDVYGQAHLMVTGILQ